MQVIFLSAYGLTWVVARVFETGIAYYIAKIFPPTVLLARVRAALQWRIYSLPFRAA